MFGRPQVVRSKYLFGLGGGVRERGALRMPFDEPEAARLSTPRNAKGFLDHHSHTNRRSMARARLKSGTTFVTPTEQEMI